MRKLYNINNQQMGIDLDKVLCFYIDGTIDTYANKYNNWLNILISDKIGPVHLLKLVYQSAYSDENNGINPEVNKLYQDLIEYYGKE